MRQSANSAVRFSTYSTLKQFVQGNSRPGQNLPSGVTFGIGAVAGVVTVCEYRNCAFDAYTSQLTLHIYLRHDNAPRVRSIQSHCFQSAQLLISASHSVVKTRMQSLTAQTEYKNVFHCAYRIYTEEGVLRFWRGATPRLARLVLSGGIVFTGQSLSFLNRILLPDH